MNFSISFIHAQFSWNLGFFWFLKIKCGGKCNSTFKEEMPYLTWMDRMFSCCTWSAVSKFKPHFAIKTRVIPDKANSSSRTRGIVLILRVNREHCNMCPSTARLHNYLKVRESNVVLLFSFPHVCVSKSPSGLRNYMKVQNQIWCYLFRIKVRMVLNISRFSTCFFFIAWSHLWTILAQLTT